jgi:hypothetical protein
VVALDPALRLSPDLSITTVIQKEALHRSRSSVTTMKPVVVSKDIATVFGKLSLSRHLRSGRLLSVSRPRHGPKRLPSP